MLDVCIIGAGVVGLAAARRLSRYRLDIAVVEKEADVAMGATKANSAIVHGGYAESHEKLKGRLCYQGRRQFAQLDRELHFGFDPIGSLVITTDPADLPKLRAMEENGKKNGLPDLEILGREKILELEPNLNPQAAYALWCRGAGVCSPYEMAIALGENAVKNGVRLLLRSPVTAIRREEGAFTVVTPRGELRSRFVINCAGLESARVDQMVNPAAFSIRPRTGEYILFARGTGSLLNTVVFQMPSKMGKGILVTPTYHGNLLLGPDAIDQEGDFDRGTHPERLAAIYRQGCLTTGKMDPARFIRSFAGVRAVSSTDDFIVGAGGTPGFLNAAGIQSPGLTSSPAIADLLAEELAAQGLPLEEKPDYDPFREPVIRRDKEFLPIKEAMALAQLPPSPERMVCRCEQVREREIVDAIHRGIPVVTVDGVKRRTRASMGFCQGNFCRPRILEILRREVGEDHLLDDLTDVQREGARRVTREEFLAALKD